MPIGDRPRESACARQGAGVDIHTTAAGSRAVPVIYGKHAGGNGGAAGVVAGADKGKCAAADLCESAALVDSTGK